MVSVSKFYSELPSLLPAVRVRCNFLATPGRADRRVQVKIVLFGGLFIYLFPRRLPRERVFA